MSNDSNRSFAFQSELNNQNTKMTRPTVNNQEGTNDDGSLPTSTANSLDESTHTINTLSHLAPLSLIINLVNQVTSSLGKRASEKP